jgi:signal transduction histidine kinase
MSSTGSQSIEAAGLGHLATQSEPGRSSNAQSDHRGKRDIGTMMNHSIINWFIPADLIRARTNIELARVFVFTHLFGPLIAQPMAVYLYLVSPEVNLVLEIMVFGICSFWALPFILRWTGNMTLVALMSYQGLAAISLFGTYFYGGFSSPFLPWLIVSLLLGFFYLSRNTLTVMALFAIDLAIFLSFLWMNGLPNTVPLADLRILGWLSIVAATVYMSWMAMYYARMIALRSELQVEAERYRSTLEELERARSAAEKISGNRSRFFAKMSHELRTPLNVIIGYSEILMEDSQSGGATNEQHVKDLGRINAAGNHLLSLVAEVLDTDNIVNDVQTVEPTTFSLGELCEDVVANALPMVKKNDNVLIVDCPHRKDTLTTDRKMLRQMLINLLSNAGKFTKNGTITLHMSVQSNAADDRLHATVTDTGIGIAAETLPKLFNSYMQADPTIANKYGGTGIGLSISRKFSVLLGGDISVTSKMGEGSQFHIDVPAHLHPGDSTGDRSVNAVENSPPRQRPQVSSGTMQPVAAYY